MGRLKVIHCADLHLDSKLNTNFGYAQAKERRLELLQSYLRMVEFAAEHGVEVILIAGDWFDIENVTNSTQTAVYDSINNHPNIEFYYVQGNHDRKTERFPWKMPSNLHCFGEDWISYYPWDSEWVAITGVNLSENNQKLWNSLNLNPEDFNVVMLHGQVLDAWSSTGKDIPLMALKNKSIDYLALGHIHEYREEKLDERGVYCYSGCLEGRGFDECGEHGFMLLELDEEKRTCQRSWIPFAKRRLYQLQVNISDCMNSLEILREIEDTLADNEVEENDLLKVILVGEVDALCEKNLAFLETQLSESQYLVKVYDETQIQLDYSQFVNDPSLKGEFVRCVMQAGEISEGRKREVIRCGLQALSGEEFD
ncbi:MAG: exonuclease SbcCD subunit D [Lachnospiraceae bacterium]